MAEIKCPTVTLNTKITSCDGGEDIWSTERGIDLIKKQCEVTGQDLEYVRGLIRRLDAPKCNADDLRGKLNGISAVSVLPMTTQPARRSNYTPPKKKHKKRKK